MVDEKRAMKRSRDVGNNSANWGGGTCKILVEKTNANGVSDFYMVNLRENIEDSKIGGFLLKRHVSGSVLGKVGMGKKKKLFAMGRSTKKETRNNEKDVDGDVIHSGVSYYDFSSPKKKWKHLPAKMLIPDRDNPAFVSLGSKIFVFGGVSDISDCFGEFYDTADDKEGYRWRPILIPSIVPVDLTACFISDPINNRILCIFPSTSSLYAYYPDIRIPYQRWVCIRDKDVPYPSPFFANAPIHGLLFFFDTYRARQIFTAYDILTNQTLPVSWSSYKPFGPTDLSRHTFNAFLSLGDDVLCLPDFGQMEIDPATGLRIKVVLVFYRFRAHLQPSKGVVITPLQVHRIPVQGFNLVRHFLPL